MSNLTSSVPGATDALLSLLTTAAAGMSNPPVQVFDSELIQYEPAAYVLFAGVDSYEIELAALGSYAHYENYDLCGRVSYLQGNVDPKTIRATTWSIFQTVVMGTIITNRGTNGQQVLGSSAPTSLQWVLPGPATYRGEPVEFGSGQAGFGGTIDWCVHVRSRITVP